MKEEQQIKQTVKKNDMYAENIYQIKRLADENFYFVPCSIEETQDEVQFVYDITGMTSFEEAKTSRDFIKYGLLIQTLEAVLNNPQFCFSLNPQNIYIDMQGRIRILSRDYVSKQGQECDSLTDLLSLAGSYFQKKFTYEDYKNGGLELLKRQKRTRFLSGIQSLEEAMDTLKGLQQQAQQRDQAELVTIKRRGYHAMKLSLCFLLMTAVGLSAFLAYQILGLYYPQKRALMAERAYMENNLTMAADALLPIPVNRMDNHEKYLLAISYIRGQSVDSFDWDTKERLISRLSYDGDHNLLDYWIHLGRMEVDEALETAMRMSDNQLLLYAYLQKLEHVSSDTEMPGEEKAQQIDSLKGKIKTLADELGIDYKENQAEGEEVQ